MITRAARRDRFTVVHNATIEDGRVSFRALGLLVYILSKPDNWKTHIKHLATTHSEGREAVRAAMVELEIAGYITRKWLRAEGQVAPTMHYLVSEVVAGTSGGEGASGFRVSGQPDLVDHAESPGCPETRNPDSWVPRIRVAQESAPSKEGSLVSTDLEDAASRPPARVRSDAEDIVRTWWETSSPPPVNSRIGVVKVVERFLGVGYPAEAVAKALRSAWCPTVNALLIEMRSTKPNTTATEDQVLKWLMDGEDGGQ